MSVSIGTIPLKLLAQIGADEPTLLTVVDVMVNGHIETDDDEGVRIVTQAPLIKQELTTALRGLASTIDGKLETSDPIVVSREVARDVIARALAARTGRDFDELPPTGREGYLFEANRVIGELDRLS